MIVNLEELQRLVDDVGAFIIRDRTMKREQEEMCKHLLAAQTEGKGLSTEQVARYRTSVQRYFAKFNAESTRHLRDIDRRLEQLAQLQANAVAERGVAARRTELTLKVLTSLERV
jgi:hypothetical protein